MIFKFNAVKYTEWEEILVKSLFEFQDFLEGKPI